MHQNSILPRAILHMIISGIFFRRMFPGVTISICNLHPTTMYSIALEIIPADVSKFKYVSNTWTPCGEAEYEYTGHRYIHSSSPTTGKSWMSHPIQFHKAKITNNRHLKGEKIVSDCIIPVVRSQLTCRDKCISRS